MLLRRSLRSRSISIPLSRKIALLSIVIAVTELTLVRVRIMRSDVGFGFGSSGML